MDKQLMTQQLQLQSNDSSTLDRIFAKLGDILAPRTMKNINNVVVGFPLVENVKQKSKSIYSLSEQIDFLNSTSSFDDDEDLISRGSLSKRIEATLREAKSQGFDCGEVLVPTDLTSRVAESVMKMAEDEPCGIRGCIIYINYEDAKQTCSRRVGKVRCDPDSVATFEVVLTLRPDTTGWLRLLPLKGCWRKFRSNGSLVVSSGYTLEKNKLYRSNQL